MRISLSSNIWNKSHFKYYLKNQIIITIVTTLLVFIICSFVIPSLTIKKHGTHDKHELDLFNTMVENQGIILIFGLCLGLIFSSIMKSMNDKPLIVLLEINNDSFKVITRRPKISSMKEFKGELSQLKIKVDNIKLSLFDTEYRAYKFYRDDDYLGRLIPDHFIWENFPRRKIFEALKNLNSIIARPK